MCEGNKSIIEFVQRQWLDLSVSVCGLRKRCLCYHSEHKHLFATRHGCGGYKGVTSALPLSVSGLYKANKLIFMFCLSFSAIEKERKIGTVWKTRPSAMIPYVLNTLFFKIHHTCPWSITIVTTIWTLNSHKITVWCLSPASGPAHWSSWVSSPDFRLGNTCLWELGTQLHNLRATMEKEMDWE